jgi:uncharacterized LabA/DUF88 family protein
MASLIKEFYMFLIKWFSKFKPVVFPKRIAYMDGDQDITGLKCAYHKHLHGVETHLVRTVNNNTDKPPRQLECENGFNKIYLRGYRSGKEVTDKFIGASIQKAVSEGYKEITVVSGDYDFVDIFKMALALNPDVIGLTFRMIVLGGHTNSKDYSNVHPAIQIVKM